MGSLKRAELRRQQKQQAKLARVERTVFGADKINALEQAKATLGTDSLSHMMDTAYRLDTADKLIFMGVPPKVAHSVIAGMERAVDEEIQTRFDALRIATTETAEVLETQICEINIALFLRAVELTFGNLKTVQHGYSKLLDNYNAAVAEVEEVGAEMFTRDVTRRTGLDVIVEDVDLPEVFDYWETALLAAKELGHNVVKTQEREKEYMRLVDLDKLDIPGKSLVRKALDKYEREHPQEEFTLDAKEWDIELHKKDDGTFPVTIRRKAS